MEELNQSFSDYIKEFKKMPIREKREELIQSIKELIVGFEFLSNEDNIELHYLKSEEILDLNNKNVSEDDFIEAALVYVEVAKNMIGEYLEKRS